MSSYLHTLDGRLRIRLSQLRGNRRAAVRLRQRMRALPGVASVDANPLTGSVLVEYDEEELSNEDILDALELEEVPIPTDQDPSSPSRRISTEQLNVKRVVTEKVIEFAAERLLLAVLL